MRRESELLRAVRLLNTRETSAVELVLNSTGQKVFLVREEEFRRLVKAAGVEIGVLGRGD